MAHLGGDEVAGAVEESCAHQRAYRIEGRGLRVDARAHWAQVRLLTTCIARDRPREARTGSGEAAAPPACEVCASNIKVLQRMLTQAFRVAACATFSAAGVKSVDVALQGGHVQLSVDYRTLKACTARRDAARRDSGVCPNG